MPLSLFCCTHASGTTLMASTCQPTNQFPMLPLRSLHLACCIRPTVAVAYDCRSRRLAIAYDILDSSMLTIAVCSPRALSLRYDIIFSSLHFCPRATSKALRRACTSLLPSTSSSTTPISLQLPTAVDGIGFRRAGARYRVNRISRENTQGRKGNTKTQSTACPFKLWEPYHATDAIGLDAWRGACLLSRSTACCLFLPASALAASCNPTGSDCLVPALSAA